MVEVSQKDREKPESVVRRFQRQVQGSGTLPKARKKRFLTKKKNKRQQKAEALYKMKIRKEVDKYKKMGIFNEEKLRDIKKRMDS